MAEPPARRRRSTAAAVAVVVALLLALWGADVLSRSAAESLVARNVEAVTGATQEPVVTTGGRFFLPQVLRGAYGEARVTVRDLRSGPLVIDEVDAELTDVRVPFHDVLVRDVRAIGVGHSEESVRLSYAALNDYLEATGRPITIDGRSGDQGVTATAAVTVLDQRIAATADLRLEVADGGLRLVPEAIRTQSQGLSDLATLLLNQRLTVSVPLGDLPFSQRLTSVDVGDDGLVVHTEGDEVVLRP